MIDKNPNVNLKYEIVNWQKLPSLWYTGNMHTWPNAKCDLQNSPRCTKWHNYSFLLTTIKHSSNCTHQVISISTAIGTVLKSARNPASLLKLQVQERSFSPYFYLYLFLHSQRPTSSRLYTHCFCTINWNTAWGREELWLVDVVPNVLWEEDHEQKWLKEEEEEDGEKENSSMVYLYNIEKCFSTNMLDALVL